MDTEIVLQEGKSAIANNEAQNAIAEAVLKGNLKGLPPALKTAYYSAVCQSIGLNPATKPFDFIDMQGKEVLYPGKSCAEQLRSLKGISLSGPKITYDGALIMVEITATDRKGRTDTDFGILDTTAGLNKSLSRADAILKAITKAKRRVTLSICGLGYLDETANKIEMGEAALIEVGEFIEPTKSLAHGVEYMSQEDLKIIGEAAKAAGLTKEAYQLYLRTEFPARPQSEFEKSRMDKILCDFEDASIVKYWNEKVNPKVGIE